jgi:hypothetical protein
MKQKRETLLLETIYGPLYLVVDLEQTREIPLPHGLGGQMLTVSPLIIRGRRLFLSPLMFARGLPLRNDPLFTGELLYWPFDLSTPRYQAPRMLSSFLV